MTDSRNRFEFPSSDIFQYGVYNDAALVVIPAASQTVSAPDVHGETYSSIRLSVVSRDSGSSVFGEWSGDYSDELSALLDAYDKEEDTESFFILCLQHAVIGAALAAAVLLLILLATLLRTF